MKYGCCVGIDKYNDLAGLGYDFIELAGTDIYSMSDSEFERARDLITKGPISCLRVNSFMPSDIRIIGDNIDWERIDEYVGKLFYRASLIGVETIGLGCPVSRNIPEGFPKEKAIKQFVELIKFILDRTEEYSIRLLIEAVNKDFTNFINTIDEALYIVKQVNSQYAPLMLDLYHFWVENEDINSIDSEVVKYLWHVHIAEERGRRFLVPSGIDKYKLYIDRLKELGYDGTISVEADYTDFMPEADISIKILKEIGK